MSIIDHLKGAVQLFFREFKQFFTNDVALLIFILAPVAYGVLIGSVYRDAKLGDVPIVVVDLDDTPMSRSIIEAFNDNQYVEVAAVLHDNHQLKRRMVENDWQAIVHIPDRFEADVYQKRHPEIVVDIDAANILPANYANSGILTVLGTINAGTEIESLQKQGEPVNAAYDHFEAFGVSTTRHFNPANNYLIFFYPGILGTVMQQVFLIAMALSFAKEFDDDTFGEVLQRTKSSLLVLLSKALPYLLLGALVWFLVIKTMFPAFMLPAVELSDKYLQLTFFFMLALTFLGAAFSILLPSQLKAMEVLMVIAVPSFIISGYTWPLYQMPEWIQTIASMIPLTHYVEGFRDLFVYGAEVVDTSVAMNKLMLIGGISFLMAWLFLQLKIWFFLRKQKKSQ